MFNKIVDNYKKLGLVNGKMAGFAVVCYGIFEKPVNEESKIKKYFYNFYQKHKFFIHPNLVLLGHQNSCTTTILILKYFEIYINYLI